MGMKVTMGNPLLIFLYSFSLFIFGCAIGLHWKAHTGTALLLVAAGSVLMVIHDLGIGIMWFVISAKMLAENRRAGK